MYRDKKRFFIYSAVVAVICSSLIYLGGFFSNLDLKITDFFTVQSVERSKAGKKHVAFAVISDSSLKLVERLYGMGWPWRRSMYGKVAELTALCGAKTTLFDMFFTEKSIYRVSATKPYRDINDDMQFAKQVAANGRVVLAYQNATKRMRSFSKTVQQLLERFALTVTHKDSSVSINSFPAAITPVKSLLQRSAALGCVQGSVDMDGLVRKARLLFKVDGKYYPSLSLAAYIYAHKTKKVVLEDGSIRVGKLKIPVDSEGFLRLKFYGDNNVYYDFNLIYFFIALDKIKRHYAAYKKSVIGKVQYSQEAICRDRKKYQAVLTVLNKEYLRKFKLRFYRVMQQPLNIVIKGKKYSDASLLKKSNLFAQYMSSLSDQQLLPLIGKFARKRGHNINVKTLRKNRRLFLAFLKGVNLEFSPRTFPILGLKRWKIGKRIVKKELLFPWHLTNKHIIVGSIASGLQDIWPTPFNPLEAGMHVHATALDNMLQNDFFTIVESKILYLLVICLFSILVCYFCLRLSIVLASLCSVGLLLSIIAVSWFLIAQANILFYPLSAVFAICFSYAIATILRFILELKQKRYLKNAFGQYLSPKVIDIILKDPSKLQLGGQKREMTAFFSDLQGSSTIAEKLSPEEVVSLFNDYLTRMCNIIAKYNGIVDKFEGDAIVAFWGAPLEQTDHAYLTCCSAIEMQKAMIALREEYEVQGKPALHMRIGINSGEMVVGNMGSQQRMDYTIMGDSVNLAARLEGANKFYGTYTMISEFTYSLVQDRVTARELDKINVFGKEQPVTVYELLDLRGQLDEKKQKIIALYEQGLQLYKERKFHGAADIFRKILSQATDPPSQTYLNRCEEYRENPPPADWDGVYRLTSKG